LARTCWRTASLTAQTTGSLYRPVRWNASAKHSDGLDLWSKFDAQAAEHKKQWDEATNGLFDKHKANFVTDKAANEKLLQDLLNLKDFNSLADFLRNREIVNSCKRPHFEALLDLYSKLGQPDSVRNLFALLGSSDIVTDEQSYVYLFRSFWKEGYPTNLSSVLLEMKRIQLSPSKEMIDIAQQAASKANLPFQASDYTNLNFGTVDIRAAKKARRNLIDLHYSINQVLAQQ